MSWNNLTVGRLMVGGLMVVAVGLAGCGKSGEKAGGKVDPAATVKEGSKHETWWCDEHGVPEEVCAQCNNKLVADFKAKGDWCKLHDRPDSQCFICHPEKEAEFAKLYQAKYGKQPPKPTADDEKKGEGKDEAKS